MDHINYFDAFQLLPTSETDDLLSFNEEPGNWIGDETTGLFDSINEESKKECSLCKRGITPEEDAIRKKRKRDVSSVNVICEICLNIDPSRWSSVPEKLRRRIKCLRAKRRIKTKYIPAETISATP